MAAQAAAPGPRAKNRESKVDPEARWTRRGDKHHFGDKAHIAVDLRRAHTLLR